MSKEIMKRLSAIAVAGLVVVAFAFALVGCGTSSEESTEEEAAASEEYEPIDVKVGYWGGTCEAAMYVAYELGFFEEYGINAEMYNITAGGQGTGVLVQETADNGEYFIFNATPNFLPAMASGLDIKYISEVHSGCIQACATAESGITDVAGLEGQKVGTFDTADMGQIFLSAAMAYDGADPSTVEFITEGNISTMLNAASSGEIVAFANFDPYVEICCQYFGYTKIFNNATDENFADQTCCFLAANNPVYSDPEVANRIANAINDACAWITANPEEAAKIIQGENESGTMYVTPTAQLLEAFGVDSSQANGTDLHQTLIESYTWGDNGEDHFLASIKSQWETIDTAGMKSVETSNEELADLCACYSL